MAKLSAIAKTDLDLKFKSESSSESGSEIVTLTTHSEDSTINKQSNFWKGFLLSFLCGSMDTLAACTVKYLKDISPYQLACYRCIGIFLFNLPSVVKSGKCLFGPKRLLHFTLLRAILGGICLIPSYIAYQNLPVVEITVIKLSSPVLVTTMARLFLHEPCGLVQLLTILIAAVGLLLITKLPLILADRNFFYTSDEIRGLSAALVVLLLFSCIFIVIRRLKNVHHSIIMFNYSLISLVITAALTVIDSGFIPFRCGADNWLVIGMAVFSFLSQYFLTRALQHNQAGPVCVIMSASEIILAFFLQVLLFHDIPDVFSIIGALLVAASTIIVLLEKWISALPRDSAFAKKFSSCIKFKKQ